MVADNSVERKFRGRVGFFRRRFFESAERRLILVGSAVKRGGIYRVVDFFGIYDSHDSPPVSADIIAPSRIKSKGIMPVRFLAITFLLWYNVPYE